MELEIDRIQYYTIMRCCEKKSSEAKKHLARVLTLERITRPDSAIIAIFAIGDMWYMRTKLSVSDANLVAKILAFYDGQFHAEILQEIVAR